MTVSGLEEDALEALDRMRAVGTDLAAIEAKSAAGGMPSSALDTLSAFANTGGGLLLLGVDESSGFSVVDVDAPKLASDLASQAADMLDPPLRPEIEIVTIEGKPIVAARVDELPVDRRPCYVRKRGMDSGSFKSTHDGDRALTSYEVHILVASCGQPDDDRAVVDDATIDDLDSKLVDALIDRLRATRGRVFAEGTPTEILETIGVVARVDGVVRPTLSGLMALGTYPQRFFPQLNVTFVAYPTTSGEPLASGTRFLDNQRIDGPIPLMVAETLAALRRNMKRRSIVAGVGREDIWEYPEEAIRELVTNALVHRDYHPMAQGTQVRVELFPDRLVISSPGGLHGPVPRDDLLAEPVSSSRNGLLARLLEDVAIPGTDQRVCENRATGLIATATALRRAGMQPPELEDRVREFRAVVYNHGLLDDAALAWLARIDTSALNDQQRLGLAFAWRTGSITNQQYRTVTGVDALTATRELGVIAAEGLITKSSDRRWAKWHLSSETDREMPTPRQAPLDLRVKRRATEAGRRTEIIRRLATGPKSAAELREALGFRSTEGVRRWLRKLEADGEVRPTEGARKSRLNKWELVPTAIPNDMDEGPE